MSTSIQWYCGSTLMPLSLLWSLQIFARKILMGLWLKLLLQAPQNN